MKYLEWAPPALVELHKKRMDSLRADVQHELDQLNQDEVYYDHEPMEEEENNKEPWAFRDVSRGDYRMPGLLRNLGREEYRRTLKLGYHEGTELLGKLITHVTMNDVWETLNRRIKEKTELNHQFFDACEGCVAGWLGDLKHTGAERKAFYKDISDTALTLKHLMRFSNNFYDYSINIHSSACVNGPADDSYTSIGQVLLDISVKAKQYGQEESVVKKPKSGNAALHYFIRGLSSYLCKTYGQPLHEVVVATTGVVFDLQESIDESYVRQLVKK